MAKKFGVNITRTFTLEQTVYVSAKNDEDATEKVQNHYDNGKGGAGRIVIKDAKGLAKDAEDGEFREEFEVNDAYEEEE